MNVAFMSWVTNTLTFFYYSALFMVSKTSFAKRDETEGQTVDFVSNMLRINMQTIEAFVYKAVSSVFTT